MTISLSYVRPSNGFPSHLELDPNPFFSWSISSSWPGAPASSIALLLARSVPAPPASTLFFEQTTLTLTSEPLQLLPLCLEVSAHSSFTWPSPSHQFSLPVQFRGTPLTSFLTQWPALFPLLDVSLVFGIISFFFCSLSPHVILRYSKKCIYLVFVLAQSS